MQMDLKNLGYGVQVACLSIPLMYLVTLFQVQVVLFPSVCYTEKDPAPAGRKNRPLARRRISEVSWALVLQ